MLEKDRKAVFQHSDALLGYDPMESYKRTNAILNVNYQKAIISNNIMQEHSNRN